MDLTSSLGLSQVTAMQANNASAQQVNSAASRANAAFAEALRAAEGTASDTAGEVELDKDGDPVNEELMGACKQFEAYFLEQIFEEMEKSTKVFSDDEGDRPNSTLVNFFKDQTLQTITNQAADTQSTGLAQMLYTNMKNNLGGNI